MAVAVCLCLCLCLSASLPLPLPLCPHHPLPSLHQIYDIYDNCPRTAAYLAMQGNKTMRWLLKKLRDRFNDPASPS